jgi:hypothetical protein
VHFFGEACHDAVHDDQGRNAQHHTDNRRHRDPSRAQIPP